MRKANLAAKLLNSILPVLLAFFFGAVIIFAIGEDPIETYTVMVTKSILDMRGITRTLQIAAPLLITGMGISLCFKANVFNMGIEGQLAFGGFMAGIFGSYVTIPQPAVHIMLCFIVGMACAMLFALVPAVLRAYYHVDEMVVTLVLNYAMAKALEYLASVVFRNSGAGYVSTPPVQDTARFLLIGQTKMTGFVFVAIVVFLLCAFVMNRTTLGYRIEAIGKNPNFAEATGLRSRKTVMVLMLLSGALSGIAGTGWMLSEKTFYTLDFSGSPGLGWDGMLIALLGRHSPIGIFVAALFYSALKTGSERIGLYTDVPNEIVSVIQSLIVLFLAVQILDERYALLSKLRQRKALTRRTEDERP